MVHNNNWLIDLWKREWERRDKNFFRPICTEILCIAAVCVIFVIWSPRLDKLMDYVFNMPAAVYAFWGFEPGAETGKASFYVQWVLMLLQVWIAWRWSARTIRSVWDEEEQGSVYYVCNQWYGRQQIALAKYLWNVVNFLLEYSVLFAACAVLTGNGWGMGRLTGLFLKGLPVMISFISISFFYAAVSERKKAFFWTDILVFGTLAVGNFYKIRDLIVLLLQRSNRSYIGIYHLTGWLDGLRWMSPLSWLNPFVRFGTAETVGQIAICMIIITASSAFGLLGYRVRRLK